MREPAVPAPGRPGFGVLPELAGSGQSARRSRPWWRPRRSRPSAPSGPNTKFARNRTRRDRIGRWAPRVLAVPTAAAQLAWPLLPDQRWLPAAAAVSWFVTAATHAWASRGKAWALGLVALVGGVSLVVEWVQAQLGTVYGPASSSGPFGLAPTGLPLLAPLLWVAALYSALIIGRALSPRLVPLAGGWALASWSLFLEPTLVHSGYRVWSHPEPGLPQLPGVPLTCYAGWLAFSVLLVWMAHNWLPATPGAARGVPIALHLWLIGCGVATNLLLDRGWVAAVGGTAMAVVALPLLALLWQS